MKVFISPTPNYTKNPPISVVFFAQGCWHGALYRQSWQSWTEETFQHWKMTQTAVTTPSAMRNAYE
jgi:pyruvate-formate lyase-activating enzyme